MLPRWVSLPSIKAATSATLGIRAMPNKHEVIEASFFGWKCLEEVLETGTGGAHHRRTVSAWREAKVEKSHLPTRFHLQREQIRDAATLEA